MASGLNADYAIRRSNDRNQISDEPLVISSYQFTYS